MHVFELFEFPVRVAYDLFFYSWALLWSSFLNDVVFFFINDSHTVEVVVGKIEVLPCFVFHVLLDCLLCLLDVERHHSIVHFGDQIVLVSVLSDLSLTALLLDFEISVQIWLVHLLRELNVTCRVRIVEILFFNLLLSVAVFSLFEVRFARVISKRPRVEVISSFW